MESLFILIPVAMIFCGLAVWAYLWAIDSGQYDDLDKESHRILFDDDKQVDKPADKHDHE
jgi:cbb3-type cytochrome oxidase maturation protein